MVSIVVIRHAGRDAYGDPTVATPTRHTIADCVVAPGLTNLRADSVDVLDRGREGIIAGVTVYAPADADVRHTDRVEVAGVTYDVEGDPSVFVNPYTGSAGAEIALRRTAG